MKDPKRGSVATAGTGRLRLFHNLWWLDDGSLAYMDRKYGWGMSGIGFSEGLVVWREKGKEVRVGVRLIAVVADTLYTYSPVEDMDVDWRGRWPMRRIAVHESLLQGEPLRFQTMRPLPGHESRVMTYLKQSPKGDPRLALVDVVTAHVAEISLLYGHGDPIDYAISPSGRCIALITNTRPGAAFRKNELTATIIIHDCERGLRNALVKVASR